MTWYISFLPGSTVPPCLQQEAQLAWHVATEHWKAPDIFRVQDGGISGGLWWEMEKIWYMIIYYPVIWELFHKLHRIIRIPINQPRFQWKVWPGGFVWLKWWFEKLHDLYPVTVRLPGPNYFRDRISRPKNPKWRWCVREIPGKLSGKSRLAKARWFDLKEKQSPPWKVNRFGLWTPNIIFQ